MPRDYRVEITYIYGWNDKEQEKKAEEDNPRPVVGTMKVEGKDLPVKWGGNERGGIIIGWAASVGFGTLTYVMRNDQIEVDTESMSDEFIDQVFVALRKQAVRVG